MGRACIDVEVQALAGFLVLLPSTFRVVGSEASKQPDEVRLILESELIADSYDGDVTGYVTVNGCTKTMTVAPKHDIYTPRAA
jgi:hypothetical protein